MRPFSPKEERNIERLTTENIEMAFLMPTSTGLGKSIMDATATVRLFLLERDIHDYENQRQGQEHKKIVHSFIAQENSLVESECSLYRPTTKKGDPRIWFTGLKKFASPLDILGIFRVDDDLCVLNISRLDVDEILSQGSINPVADLIRSVGRNSNFIASELLEKIKEISRRGFIQGVGRGDTAIGRTLESLLGISMNSSKQPDYKGIELKSFRYKRNRKSFFTKVPNWELSKFKSSDEILDNFGYRRGEEFKLNCTVNSLKPNSQGLQLRLEKDLAQLAEFSQNPNIGSFVVWELAVLHDALKKKHKETFWVGADTRMEDEKEFFSFNKVEHTRSPIVTQFDLLIEQGIITLDHQIKRQEGGRAHERGPSFKIKPKKLGLLFPPSLTYQFD